MRRSFFDDQGVPNEILELLGMGGEGSGHLAGIARALFGAAANSPDGRGLLALGLDAALAAFEADPLHPLLSRYLLSLCEAMGKAAPAIVPPGLSASLRALADLCSPPEDEAYLARLEKSAPDRLASRLAARMNEAPGRLYYLREYLALAGRTGDFAARAEALARPLPRAAEPVRRRLLADALAALDRPEESLKELEGCAGFFSPAHLQDARSLRLAAMGDREGALAALREAATARPWQAGPLLRLHDLALGFDRPRPAERPDAAAVLFYAFDKPDLLEKALAAVSAADPAPDRIIVLDNGGPPALGEVAAAFAERLGPDRFESLRLPVNVGAPAARNWLVRHVLDRHPGRFGTLVFLDDDAYVPPDFLARLRSAMAAYPDAGVWGCKTVNAGEPRLVQHADGHLLAPREAEEAAGENPAERAASFALYRPQESGPDLGQFAYMRPCATVTGCCHAFRTSLFEKGAPFDLLFSPSQFDDLDHDLALAEAGLCAVYQGHLTVRHAKSTGLGQGLSPNAEGNMLKLYRKWPEKRIAALRLRLADAVLADLAAKRARLTDLKLLP